MKLYIYKDGRILGPFSEQEVRDQLAAGKIAREDMVAVEGDANWTSLGESPFARAPVFPPPLIPPMAVQAPIPPPIRAAFPSATPSASPVYHTGSLAPHPGTSNLAIASLILGILGPFCLLPILPGIIVGHLALRETNRIPGLQGRGLAITGLILCYGFVVLAFLITAIVVNFSGMHPGHDYTWHPGH